MKNQNPVDLLEPALRKAAGAGRPVRVLFVCTGNICRSPLAHAVFDHEAARSGLSDLFQTESSGTFGYHLGENADDRMRRTAANHGVRLDHMVRKFSAADIEYFDLLLAMDSEHYDHMRGYSNDPLQKSRILMYREFDTDPWRGADVPDPYYGKQAAFDEVFSIVQRSTAGLLDSLRKGMSSFS